MDKKTPNKNQKGFDVAQDELMDLLLSLEKKKVDLPTMIFAGLTVFLHLNIDMTKSTQDAFIMVSKAMELAAERSANGNFREEEDKIDG